MNSPAVPTSPIPPTRKPVTEPPLNANDKALFRPFLVNAFKTLTLLKTPMIMPTMLTVAELRPPSK